jgi:hypothetical protein
LERGTSIHGREAGREFADLAVKRTTNRLSYRKRDPEGFSEEEVTAGAAETPDVRVDFVGKPALVSALATALGSFEGFSLRCPRARAQILEVIAMGQAGPIGIPLDALGLDPGARLGFRAAMARPNSQWVWSAISKVFGIVARSRVASSFGIIAFSLPGERSPRTHFQLGFALSQVWIRCTAQGLVGCPMASFLYPRYCRVTCDASAACRVVPPLDWWKGILPAEPELVLRVGLPRKSTGGTPRRPSSSVLVAP